MAKKGGEIYRYLGATKPTLLESFAPSAERVARAKPRSQFSDPVRRHLREKGAPVDYVRLASS